MMGIDVRKTLLARYEQGNEALKQRYFPDWGDEPLFDPPRLGDVANPSDIEKLQAENALLTRAIYTLAQRLEKLENGK
jgi:hypothetical protein